MKFIAKSMAPSMLKVYQHRRYSANLAIIRC